MLSLQVEVCDKQTDRRTMVKQYASNFSMKIGYAFRESKRCEMKRNIAGQHFSVFKIFSKGRFPRGHQTMTLVRGETISIPTFNPFPNDKF